MTRINLKESHVLTGVKRFLDALKLQRRLTYRRINISGVRRNIGNGRMIFTKNEMVGMSDIQVFLNTDPPRTLHVELKAWKGSLSKEQKAWRDELAEVGHKDYYVVRDVFDLASILNKFGITHWMYPVEE